MKRLAPDWHISKWFNSTSQEPLSISDFRGQVVCLLFFQMMCHGCIERALPQMKKVQALFEKAPLKVIAIHSVFEAHEQMSVEKLEVFLREEAISFLVGVDQLPKEGEFLPQTMNAYGLDGTPALLLIDHNGYLRRRVIGYHDDMLLGADLGVLIQGCVGAVSGQTSDHLLA